MEIVRDELEIFVEKLIKEKEVFDEKVWDKEKINYELIERNFEFIDKVSDLEKENEVFRNELDEIGDGVFVFIIIFLSDG